jgi:hypothetical protein
MIRLRAGLTVAALLAALATSGVPAVARSQHVRAPEPATQSSEAAWTISWVYPDGDLLLPDEGEPAGHITLRYERPGADRFKSTVVEVSAQADGVTLTMFRADLEDGVRTYDFRLPVCKTRGIEAERGLEPGTMLTVTYHARVFDIEDDGSITELGEQTSTRTLTLGPGDWCRLV